MTGHSWRRFALYLLAGFAVGAGVGTLGAELHLIHSLRRSH